MRLALRSDEGRRPRRSQNRAWPMPASSSPDNALATLWNMFVFHTNSNAEQVRFSGHSGVENAEFARSRIHRNSFIRSPICSTLIAAESDAASASRAITGCEGLSKARVGRWRRASCGVLRSPLAPPPVETALALSASTSPSAPRRNLSPMTSLRAMPRGRP